jgi:hypothetical protein
VPAAGADWLAGGVTGGGSVAVVTCKGVAGVAGPVCTIEGRTEAQPDSIKATKKPESNNLYITSPPSATLSSAIVTNLAA